MKYRYLTKTNIEILVIGLSIFIGLGIYGYATGIHIEDIINSLIKLDLATATCQGAGYTNCSKDPKTGQVTHGSCYAGYIETSDTGKGGVFFEGKTCQLASISNPPQSSIGKNTCPTGTYKDTTSGLCLYQQQPQYGETPVNNPTAPKCLFTYNLFQMALDCFPISGSNSTTLQPQDCSKFGDNYIFRSGQCVYQPPSSPNTGSQQTTGGQTNDAQVTALQQQISQLQSQLQQNQQQNPNDSLTNNQLQTQILLLTQQIQALQSQIQTQQQNHQTQTTPNSFDGIWNLLLKQPLIILTVIILIILITALVHFVRSKS